MRGDLIAWADRPAGIGAHSAALLDTALLEAAALCFAEPARSPERLGDRRAREMLRHLDDWVSADPGAAPTLLQVCTELAVPLRTLNTACRAVVGMGAARYLRQRRVHAVRRSLLQGESSVTQAATAQSLGIWAASPRPIARPSASVRPIPVATGRRETTGSGPETLRWRAAPERVSRANLADFASAFAAIAQVTVLLRLREPTLDDLQGDFQHANAASLGRGACLPGGCGPTAEEQHALDSQKCAGFGNTPGTDAFAACMMTVSQEREAQEAADRRAAAARDAAVQRDRDAQAARDKAAADRNAETQSNITRGEQIENDDASKAGFGPSPTDDMNCTTTSSRSGSANNMTSTSSTECHN